MLLALTLLTALHAGTPADSIKGSWSLKGDVVGNPFAEVCEINQTGASLAGSCVDAKGATQMVTGQVKDGVLTFQHGGDYDGQELTLIFSGKLETPTKLTGTIEVKPFSATGTFTGEPAPAKK
jgi:hypothetical protein